MQEFQLREHSICITSTRQSWPHCHTRLSSLSLLADCLQTLISAPAFPSSHQDFACYLVSVCPLKCKPAFMLAICFNCRVDALETVHQSRAAGSFRILHWLKFLLSIMSRLWNLCIDVEGFRSQKTQFHQGSFIKLCLSCNLTCVCVM